MAEKRACKGTTKAGKPCRANPLHDGDYCLAHSDPETRESVGFIPDNGFGGRKPNPRAVDVLREKLEAEIDEWLQVYIGAREATKPVGVGSGEDFQMVEIPDHALRLRALADAFDRVYGKPKQATELSGPGGEPIRTEGDAPDLDRLTPDELRAYLAMVKKMRGDGGEQ